MTRLLTINQARLVARSRSLRTALVLYVLALGLGTLMLLPVPFVDTTAPAGTPALDVAWWIWAVLTPWWVSRLLSVERGDAFVAFAAQAGAAPEQGVLAQLLAAFLFACELALVSLPIGIVAYLSGRAAVADVAWAAAELAALASAAIVVTFHCSIRGEARIASWTTATVITLVTAASFDALSASMGRGAALALVAGLALALALGLPVRARRQLLYAER